VRLTGKALQGTAALLFACAPAAPAPPRAGRPGAKGEDGIWTAAPSHAHAVTIAAAATAKSAVAMPIEIARCPCWRVEPRLSCSNRGAKRRPARMGRFFRGNGLCDLGVSVAGCFNRVAPRAPAVAAMLTEWVAMGGRPADGHGPTNQDNHATL